MNILAFTYHHYLCHVKIILFLFSFYFLGLNIMPCNDADVDTHDDVEQIAEAGDCDDNESHDHEDECSPFCQCNCCSVHVITYEFQSLEIIEIPEINTQISSYINPFYDGYDGSILQPPRFNS